MTYSPVIETTCLPRRAPLRDPARINTDDALWRMVEGAVFDAFLQHPDYLTDKGRRSAITSVTKRVSGALVGHHKETRKGGRESGSRHHADCIGAAGSGAALGLVPPIAGGGAHAPADIPALTADCRAAQAKYDRLRGKPKSNAAQQALRALCVARHALLAAEVDA